MLTALVLICSSAVTPDARDCSRDHAETVMRAPIESAHPATCFMHGQAFFAETEIGRTLSAGDLVKIICVPTSSINASIQMRKADGSP